MGAHDLSSPQPLRDVGLDDKYTASAGAVLLTGVQALVRLPMLQRQRDRAAGLRTAGYISGYRGSPLGTYDEQLHKAGKLLASHNVVFQPGLNEDLAATAVWGSQQAEAQGEGRHDGVFALWYGKGPGVDRSGDAFRHGNLAGSSRHGGVLVVAGDDHTCESSTTCHQSEFALMDAMIPVLSPAGVAEVLSFGLLGWAMSRFSGCWVGLKCVKDTADATAVVDLGALPAAFAAPEGFTPPPDGLSLRQPDTPQAQEYRLHNHKLEAAQAFARANRIDRVVGESPGAWLGIAAHGKSWLDVLQALHELGLTLEQAGALGVRFFKPGMVWPLEPQAAGAFAQGLQSILVVEEKRSLVEAQLRDILYGRPNAPRIEGKKHALGGKLFAAEMALDPVQIAIAIGERLLQNHCTGPLAERVRALKVLREPRGAVELLQRSFYFCGGCPHNTSTVLPEGSRGYAGIGCSWMAQAMERSTLGYTQMGAEGLSWVGEAPFSRRTHVFQNMGDGTYFHSGLLAVRAAVAARTNITFKILFNDAVAMTGGQRHDGQLTPQAISWQVFAEGARRTVVVSDEPGKYAGAPAGGQGEGDVDGAIAAARARLAPGVMVRHRDELDEVQRELRELEGTTVLIYDQTCAAEKRRRRKRGTLEDPARRLFINELVCEGCGDCGAQSNCVSLVPLETEFGRKRAIDQSSCNKDYSCAKGFCPSFVTVTGGRLKKPQGTVGEGATAWPPLPEPPQPSLDTGIFSMLVTGVGGTGVVTVGAVLGMAAHLEGKGCAILDMAGLAQKGGSVWSHLRLARSPGEISAVRIAPGGADLVLGCDLLVTASAKTLALMRSEQTRVLVNLQENMPGEFTRRPDMVFPRHALLKTIDAVVGEGRVTQVDAGGIAQALLGDGIAANLFMLGHACQLGLVPVSPAAIERAIELNGTAVRMNLQAFAWGRRAALDPAGVARAAGRTANAPKDAAHDGAEPAQDLAALVARRRAFLSQYQDEAYAARYAALVDRVRVLEEAVHPGSTSLAEAVARQYFRLLSYKDEYEVARLHAHTGFMEHIGAQYEGDWQITFNLAPPLLARRDPRTGVPRKIALGAWMLPVFRLLAAMKRLRGTRLDVFGYTAERKMERGLIVRYERSVEAVLAHTAAGNFEAACALAEAPSSIRGFGHVKQASVDKALPGWEALEAALRGAAAP